MEIKSDTIIKAVLLTFKDVQYYEDGSIGYIPAEEAQIVVGILIDTIFLDINTNQVYDVLWMDEEGETMLIPTLEKPYIYGGNPYVFSSKEEKETVLQKAKSALEIYQEMNHLVSFAKRKRKRENKRWQK